MATDKPTVMNLTNHFYFNLNGGTKDISDERLTLFSSRYTPFDANAMPTGVVASVTGTPYDFTRPIRIGERLALPNWLGVILIACGAVLVAYRA